ncbi:HAD-IA family hydrolase [Marivivens sp. LCG002]|uniref:HAD-IA family hydrolase n=1 Tax=Marivivens sp. LCG002 TaxID=3051171 RepID=UPI002553B077|nr:HAD-IA family hydrolase [Marivivens sp. LCG002]WIV51696.1 HAD-IA family hydrolase [Marivivens sp. LCG002]
MRTVIFDLDGTLADTSFDLIEAANACFRGLGLGDLLDPVADGPVALKGGKAMLTLGFERSGTHGAEEVDRQHPVLLEHYKANINRHTFFFDGAMEAVRTLKAKGTKVGICTNKPEALALQLLTEMGVLGEFHSLIGADTLPVRKPDPLPYQEAVKRAGGVVERSLIVGDTTTDLYTSHAAGVPCVLVTFGPSGAGARMLECAAHIDHFDALPEVVERLLP